jgi:hypothetical protein
MERPVIYGVVEEAKVDGQVFPIAVLKIDPFANCVTYKRIVMQRSGDVYVIVVVMN